MTFKVGDKVKVVANPLDIDTVKDHIGKEGIIILNCYPRAGFDFLVKFTPAIKGYGKEILFDSNELELVGPRQLTFTFIE
jgi:hypothetical protein